MNQNQLREALQELFLAQAAEYPPESAGIDAQDAWAKRRSDAMERARSALSQPAQEGEVDVAIDNLHNERRDGMTNAIFPPVQIGTRLFAAQPAPVVPDGFALVPLEPTTAMLDAGSSEADDTAAIYAAMLTAAPPAPKDWLEVVQAVPMTPEQIEQDLWPAVRNQGATLSLLDCVYTVRAAEAHHAAMTAAQAGGAQA